MEVINDLLGYKDRKIAQNTDWFCFSIDSVILARLAKINLSDKKIVDFCTGNIPIPLILSSITKSKIYGIEIQKEIFDLATKSLKINKLDSQITIINDDVKNAFNYFNDESIDLVTCNPPYFKYDKSSSINSNNIKSLARHEISINIEDIIINAKKILKNKGRLSIIHSATRFVDLVTILEKYNFGIKRIIPIYTKTSSKKAEMIFVESTKNTIHSVSFESPIYIYNDNMKYTNVIESMLKE